VTLFRSIGRKRAQVPARLPAPQLGPAWRNRSGSRPEAAVPASAGPDFWPDSSGAAFTAQALDARFDPCGAPPVRRQP